MELIAGDIIPTEKPAASAGDANPSWLDNPSPRRLEVDRRQRVIGEWLLKNQFDALLLFDPENIAWFTAGGRFAAGAQALADAACLYITVQHRCLIANNHHSARLFAEEIAGLGFYLKELPWSLPVSRMVNDLCADRKVVADRVHPAVVARRIELLQIRRSLSAYDAGRFRALAADLAAVVESCARTFEPGASEIEIAGQLAHRMIRADLEPVSTILYCDGRSDGFARPIASQHPVRSQCTILATGRRAGLTATTARSVTFGAPAEDERKKLRAAAAAAASLLHFSRAGESVARTFPLAQVSFQSTGWEFSLYDAPIGGFSGYCAQLDPFLPDSTETFQPGDAFSVMPLVRGVCSAETALVGQEAAEPLCLTADWPMLSIRLGDASILRPDFLVR